MTSEKTAVINQKLHPLTGGCDVLAPSSLHGGVLVGARLVLA
jgi:hypothetical protein